MKTETKDILIHIWDSSKWYLVVILATVICMSNCKGCKTNVVTLPNHDAIYKAETVQDKIIDKAKHKDSVLTVVKIKYVTRTKTVYDSLYVTDTLCQKSLKTLYYAFSDLNVTNDSIIANKDTIIKALVNKVALKQSHITIDSTRLVQLTDTLKTVKRKGFIKGFKWGFGSGVIITQGLNTGAKLVP